MDDFDSSDLTALFAEVDKLEAQRKPAHVQRKVSIYLGQGQMFAPSVQLRLAGITLVKQAKGLYYCLNVGKWSWRVEPFTHARRTNTAICSNTPFGWRLKRNTSSSCHKRGYEADLHTQKQGGDQKTFHKAP